MFRINPFILLLLVAVGLWLIFGDSIRRPVTYNAEPRAVTARGNLAEDEKTTIEIFRNTSPSVVISPALRCGAASFRSMPWKFRPVPDPASSGTKRDGW